MSRHTTRAQLKQQLQRQWLQTALEAEVRAWLAALYAAVLREHR